MPETMIMVVSNMPNSEIAESIARELVEKQLAACVNILPGVRSVYRWQGVVETANEVTLLIKTRQACYENVEQAIQSLHPYDVPEILALPIQAGLPAYLNWMDASIKNSQGE